MEQHLDIGPSVGVGECDVGQCLLTDYHFDSGSKARPYEPANERGQHVAPRRVRHDVEIKVGLGERGHALVAIIEPDDESQRGQNRRPSGRHATTGKGSNVSFVLQLAQYMPVGEATEQLSLRSRQRTQVVVQPRRDPLEVGVIGGQDLQCHQEIPHVLDGLARRHLVEGGV